MLFNVLTTLQVYGFILGLNIILTKSGLVSIYMEYQVGKELTELVGCNTLSWALTHLGLPPGGRIPFRNTMLCRVSRYPGCWKGGYFLLENDYSYTGIFV